MGQYILFGMCHKFDIDKNQLLKTKTDKEKMIELLSKEINTDFYNITETEKMYTLKLKEEIFNSNEIISFIKEQSTMFECYELEEMCEDLSNLKSYDDIVNFANEQRYPSFQSHTEFYDIKVGHWDRIEVKIDAVIFFMQGKAYLECYKDLFDYIENLIKSSSKHQLAETVKIFLE